MTIVVLWYREKHKGLWCAADSRVSNSGATRTDRGAKVLPVAVVCRKQDPSKLYSVHARFSLGFAFAGSTLTALNTYAIASACAQNLRVRAGHSKAPSVEAIAELFRRVGDQCIRDAASRLPKPEVDGPSCFFEGILFGHCKVTNTMKAFAFAPNMTDGKFDLVKAELRVAPGVFHPMGSGAQDFLTLCQSLQAEGKHIGVMPTLSQYIDQAGGNDVGGFIQVGVASPKGFELHPILNTKPGVLDRTVTFLGIDTAVLGPDDNFAVGYSAIAPDAP